MTSERKLRFVSWNTGGIKNTRKSPKKISKVLTALNELCADIVFIQETHIGQESWKILTDEAQNSWECFFTVHSPKSKGVAILINKKTLKFEYICHDEDCSGGYIVLFCYLNDELFTLVNVYNHKEDRIVLGRLKEYLIETAEGVLVIGGDFNTVLHPSLDRKPANVTSNIRHSPFRAILEDFTVSLNLKDTWSYLHPTEEGFTHRQNESYSRLDMFFMKEDKINRLCSIQPEKQEGISDHYPLVLTITVHTVKTKEKQIPNVVKMLTKHKYTLDCRAGKISGAEILGAIKSLEESRPDGLQIRTCRLVQCAVTEHLKIHFNKMLKDSCLDTGFKREGHNFNIDYLIFTQILAKRLSAFIAPSFKGTIDKNLHIVFSLTVENGKQEISWTFLQEALKKIKQIPSSPPPDFSILDSILPKVQGEGNLRHLQPDCPLTNPILNLALNHLKDLVFDFEFRKEHKRECREIMSMASVCYQRRVLLIHTKLEEHVTEKKVKKFKEQVKKSGIKTDLNT